MRPLLIGLCFCLGDAQSQLYFLVKGQVQCYHYHLNGKLAVFGLSNPFAAIGELEILRDEPITSNVIASQPTVMLGLPKDIVLGVGSDEPMFLRFLISQLTQKLYTSNTHHKNNLLPVKNRLALYLLAHTMPAQAAISLPEKEGFASLLGTTVRHLNRVLREMANQDVITSGYPRLQILDRKQLELMTE